MKNCNMILTEKQEKYQLYCEVKLINMNFLQVKKYCHLIKYNNRTSKVYTFPSR